MTFPVCLATAIFSGAIWSGALTLLAGWLGWDWMPGWRPLWISLGGLMFLVIAVLCIDSEEDAPIKQWPIIRFWDYMNNGEVDE